MGLLNTLARSQRAQNPGTALLYGQVNPQEQDQTQPQPAAQAQMTPVVSSPAVTSPDQNQGTTAFKLPQPPAPMATPNVQSLDDWKNSTAGQDWSKYNPEYKMPGFWQRLGMSLAFGAQEVGASMRGNPGVGSRNMMDWQNNLRWQDQQNRARPGLVQQAYKMQVLDPAKEQQAIAYQAHEAGMQDFSAAAQIANLNRDLQARGAEILRSGLGMKGKVHDEDIVKSILRDSSAQGIPLNENYVRRVVGAAPIVGPRFQITKGEGGRPTGVQDTYGVTYAPNPKNEKELIGPDGKVLADPEALNVYTAGLQGHQQERAEKQQDMEMMAEAGERRARAMGDSRVIMVTTPDNKLVPMRAGDAVSTGSLGGGVSTELNKYIEPARQADKSATIANNVWNEIQKTGKITGPQAMMLLSNHIATTFGGVKGVAVGEHLIEAHHTARSLPENLWAQYNAIKNGGNISMDQAKEWMDLINESRAQQWQNAVDEGSRQGVTVKVPDDIVGNIKPAAFSAPGGGGGKPQDTQPKTQTVNGVPYQWDGKQWVKVKKG